MADLTGMLQATAGNTEAVSGQAIFTSVGSTSWVVPAGVTSISAVCIGGGGGGCETTNGGSGGAGGDLRYYNNLSVTPGETLTITVGSEGANGNPGASGGFSRIARSGTTLLEAAGGGGGTIDGSAAQNGTSSTIGGSIGGGDGGTCGDPTGSQCGGGGGAGGYAGNGGNGGINADGTAGATDSGAGGGGGGAGSSGQGGTGGGVNVFGIGSTGGGGDAGDDGQGGSYGDGGLNPNRANKTPLSEAFGAGGGGTDLSGSAINGGQGAVRIVYPGNTRSFPSTDVWMSQIIPTVIESQVSTSNTLTIPASAQAGDLAVIARKSEETGAQSTPNGWTTITNQTAANPTLNIWYRILQSGDPGTTISLSSKAGTNTSILCFRKASGTVSSVSITGSTIQQSGFQLDTQTQNISTATAPFIAFGVFGATAEFTTSVMTFEGGVAGSGNIEPAAVINKVSGDAAREVFIRFRIYDEAPSTDLSVINNDDVANQTMASFIIEVN